MYSNPHLPTTDNGTQLFDKGRGRQRRPFRQESQVSFLEDFSVDLSPLSRLLQVPQTPGHIYTQLQLRQLPRVGQTSDG